MRALRKEALGEVSMTNHFPIVTLALVGSSHLGKNMMEKGRGREGEEKLIPPQIVPSLFNLCVP